MKLDPVYFYPGPVNPFGLMRVYQCQEIEHGTPPAAILSDVADHIDYVAIGGDFYGATGDALA